MNIKQAQAKARKVPKSLMNLIIICGTLLLLGFKLEVYKFITSTPKFATYSTTSQALINIGAIIWVISSLINFSAGEDVKK